MSQQRHVQGQTEAQENDLLVRRVEALERSRDLTLRLLAHLVAHDLAVPMALRERLAHEVEEGA